MTEKASLPNLRYKVGSTVVPGDRIGNIRQVNAGPGTYISKGHIYSCLMGHLNVEPLEATEAAAGPSFQCCVQPRGDKSLFAAQALSVGQLVVGKILRITPQNAILEIRLVQGLGALQTPQEGAIRREDVRSSATEQLSLADCFQPGDLVVAKLISLGDARRYFLTTAESELGVIRAKSRVGSVMIPISWKQMECPETGEKESRKCAKPMNLKQLQEQQQEQEMEEG
ncbi:unnamed protein product [Cylindrotheca closterium]|uniref:S1 motif domain-containing protein n=1 Tax=Cylindrotheca closterium TaxID=2856 RepID=A0AAD2JHW5_9STRA|nr:unnamed protein product [Cylindrotheca closterium]